MGRRFPLFILLLFPLVGLGQITGNWSVEFSLLPVVSFTSSVLDLSYSPVEQWTLTSQSDVLGSDGWIWQEFGVQGSFQPVDLEMTVLFGPKVPTFLYTLAEAHAQFSGLDLTAYSAYVGPTVPGYAFTGGPSGGMVLELATELEEISLTATLGVGARLEDLVITYTGVGTYTKTYPVDPFPGGLRFTYIKIDAEGIPFCCGITLDTSFVFTKEEGFESLELTAENLFQLCCDISIDASLAFTTDSKTVEVRPHWKGIEGCVSVYEDVVYDQGTIDGFELYGWKVRCDFSECNSLEVLTALNPDVFYLSKAGELLVNPQPVPVGAEHLFKGGEFEYVKISTCGAGCCGGDWLLDITVYFKETSGTLFGISRFLVESSIPVMSNLDFTSTLEIAVPGGPSLDVGWELRF